MPSKQPHVRRAITRLTRLVQAESKTLTSWMRLSKKDRATRPLNERLETLLWSWPIRPALSKHPPRSLWKEEKDQGLVRRLTDLAETVYPNMRYPEAVYSMEWAPWSSPTSIHDKEFKAVCHDVCRQLRSLPGVAVPDPNDDVRWLCMLLEHGWGDGQYEHRHEEQRRVLRRLTEQRRRRVCEIGERARDAAYHEVRITRSLDAQRRVKGEVLQFTAWLQDTKTHASFVEAHLMDKQAFAEFSAAFQVVKDREARVIELVNAYMQNVFEDTGRDRRASAGRPGRGAWVKPADEALKCLKISEPDRRGLLMAWGVVPLERDIS